MHQIKNLKPPFSNGFYFKFVSMIEWKLWWFQVVYFILKHPVYYTDIMLPLLRLISYVTGEYSRGTIFFLNKYVVRIYRIYISFNMHIKFMSRPEWFDWICCILISWFWAPLDIHLQIKTNSQKHVKHFVVSTVWSDVDTFIRDVNVGPISNSLD